MNAPRIASKSDGNTGGTTPPKVSILIISYNQQSYIAEAIEGAVEQDYANVEVVVSDDASTDETPRLIEDYQRRYPQKILPLLHRDNVGITKNSNRGLRACSGEYIAFAGGDDVLLPGKISAQVRWLESEPDRVLCGHQVEVFYDGQAERSHLAPPKHSAGRGANAWIRHGGLYTPVGTMVRASCIPRHGFDEELPIVSDYMLAIEILASGGAYGNIPGVYGKYRRHDRNASTNYLRNVRDIERTLQLVTERYPQYRASCRHAMTRHVLYASAVHMLRAGARHDARRRLLEALRAEPFFLKAWLRLAQTLRPSSSTRSPQ